MHIAEVVTIAKSLPLLRLNTYKSLILSYSADYRRIFHKKKNFELYPVTFINKSINNEELNVMKRFLKGTENLLGKSNGGIKEYFFE